MKWARLSCWRNRPSISLLACGALSAEERKAMEAHLAACAQCRQRYQEISALGQDMKWLAKATPEIEPSAVWQARWRRAVRQTGDQRSEEKSWIALIWRAGQCARRKPVWAGLAAIWALVFFFRLSAPETPLVANPEMAASPRQILALLRMSPQEWLRLSAPSEPLPPVPPRPPAAPPRSDYHDERRMA